MKQNHTKTTTQSVEKKIKRGIVYYVKVLVI